MKFNHITHQATDKIAKGVADRMGLHTNSIYKMWGDPEFDRFTRFMELYTATAEINYEQAEHFYHAFKSVRDRLTFSQKRAKPEPVAHLAASVSRETADVLIAEIEKRPVACRLREAWEAKRSLDAYIEGLQFNDMDADEDKIAV